jgi:hypothetical protein
MRAEWERHTGTTSAPAWGTEAVLNIDGVRLRIPG